MKKSWEREIEQELAAVKADGLYKTEHLIESPQTTRIKVNGGRSTLNLCANNYLGLANHPEIVEAAINGIKNWGFGLSSVRFICGTQTIHRQLETTVADFLGTDDTILYSSCFDANGGLFETLLSAEDAVISDALNHASIIDGIRLCKAKRLRYPNSDMAALERCLQESSNCRRRLIATDGVFSMDGTIANLKKICELAEKYDAMVMVDDSHAVGFIGENGRGTPEYCDVLGKVDILTGTFGKALGGAGGGYVSGRQAIIDLLRQRSRPYLFSNTLSPAVVCASLKALELVKKSPELLATLRQNTRYFRDKMREAGFDIPDGDHPIVPIMLGDAHLAQKFAARLFEEGIYVIGFFYPVVPRGEARVRVQISAAHSIQELDFAIDKFIAAREAVGKQQ